ncbi:MAG TPA: ribosome small subunit-dependent GTPase A [Acidimicrobiia bacterium]|nr:ribosome small subunit-dependent GTPase A [Acidimicrobiia bacterium]
MSVSAPSFRSLADLGWDDTWAATLATAVQLLGTADPARVARVDLGACTVLGTGGAARATIPPGTTVAVGDWVLVRQDVVVGALPRRTAIIRRSAGADAQAQTLAANVDTVLVLVAADGRVTPRSIERYITLVWESGATPVVVLTKADLVSADELNDAIGRLEPACVGIDLLTISTPAGTGLDGLRRYFGAGRTVALLGSSGAGKSTLANRLADAGLATGSVREADHRGRHTTTHRELVPLPGGGVLIDSPGLREVGLWHAVPSGSRRLDQGGTPCPPGEGLARTFPEIAVLLDQCRFADCTHRKEPGCAVMTAVAEGKITQERLASWRKLRREIDRLAARDDPALRQQLRTEQRRQFREYAQARKQWRKQGR